MCDTYIIQVCFKKSLILASEMETFYFFYFIKYNNIFLCYIKCAEKDNILKVYYIF